MIKIGQTIKNIMDWPGPARKDINNSNLLMDEYLRGKYSPTLSQTKYPEEMNKFHPETYCAHFIHLKNKYPEERIRKIRIRLWKLLRNLDVHPQLILHLEEELYQLLVSQENITCNCAVNSEKAYSSQIEAFITSLFSKGNNVKKIHQCLRNMMKKLTQKE